MKKSYSKIRHIQEANQRLEQEYLEEQGNLLNRMGAGLRSFGAKVGTAAGNVGKIFTGGQLDSPALAGAMAKLDSRNNYLTKQMGYLETELTQANKELNDIMTKNKNLEPTIKPLIDNINAYLGIAQQAKQTGDSFKSVYDEFKKGQQGGGTNTQQSA